MEDAVVAQWGGFGAIFIVIVGGLALEYRRLRIKFDDVQAARVQDAREVIATTKEATKDFSEILNDKGERDSDTKVVLAKIEDSLERIEERLKGIEGTLGKRRPR
jgi:hypothetical protein